MRTANLEDLVIEIIDHRGKTPKKLGTDFVPSGVPVASAQLVNGGVLDLSDCRFVDEATWQRWMPIPLRVDDILLTSEAPLGRTARVQSSDPLVLGQRLFALRTRADLLDSAYLYYWLSSRKGQAALAEQATGSTVLGIRQSALRRIKVPVPAMEEQRAIGEVLGALDDKIAANRVVMIRAEELAVALASKCDQPVRLGQVAQQRRSSVSPMKLGSETVLHYSLPAFDEGKAALESAEEIKSAKNEIENPAVLVSKLNPRIPRLWPVDTSASSVRRLASTEFVVLESSELGVGELWAAILHGDVFGQLQSIVGGTSNSHQRVRPQDVLDAVVPDTRLLDQADRKLLVSLCRLRGQLVEANDSLARTRDELLPLLMKGRITVKDAEQAAEAVL